MFFVAKRGIAVTWVWLAGAISLEVVATLNLKASYGFSRLLPSLIVVFGYIGSFILLGATLKRLDVGTVYAIWSGAGTVVVVFVGIALFGESATAMRMAGIAVIVAGVIVVNLSGGGSSEPASPSAAGSTHIRGRHADGNPLLGEARTLKAVRHGSRR
jgi:small multidrug resistance pump